MEDPNLQNFKTTVNINNIPLFFKTRLCSINTDAPTITSLSNLMRSQTSNLNVRQTLLQIWLTNVEQCSESTRLLALLYLANDVIQCLRSTEEQLIYRFSFAVPFARSILAIREKAPGLIPKVQRLLSIFKTRVIYDSLVLKLLQRVLEEEDITIIVNSVLPTLKTETTQHIHERLQQLEKESLDGQRSQSIQKTETLLSNQQQTVDQPHRPPVLDDIITAEKHLDSLCWWPRRQECVNLDAASVPHFRGHRVLPNARISTIDRNLIECYKALLHHHKAQVADVNEKMARRKKEEEVGQYSLMFNRSAQSTLPSAAYRVEVLMKKELNTRLQKLETENAIYWKLVEMLEYLGSRWQRIQSIVQRVEMETERRLKGDEGSQP